MQAVRHTWFPCLPFALLTLILVNQVNLNNEAVMIVPNGCCAFLVVQ